MHPRLKHFYLSTMLLLLLFFIYYYYYYYYKICIGHKFKHARVGGTSVAGWENGLAGEGKTSRGG